MTDSYTFKKFSKTEFLEEIPDNATILIEDSGDIKRVPASQVGVQADLTQNDSTAPDYVKGRTHWSEFVEEVLLDNVTVEIGAYDSFVLRLEHENTYTVTWDGVEYTCLCFIDNGGYHSIGNARLTGYNENFEDTGEPFYIQTNTTGSLAFGTEGNHTLSVKYNKEIVHHLDNKYIKQNDGMQVFYTIFKNAIQTEKNADDATYADCGGSCSGWEVGYGSNGKSLEDLYPGTVVGLKINGIDYVTNIPVGQSGEYGNRNIRNDGRPDTGEPFYFEGRDYSGGFLWSIRTREPELVEMEIYLTEPQNNPVSLSMSIKDALADEYISPGGVFVCGEVYEGGFVNYNLVNAGRVPTVRSANIGDTVRVTDVNEYGTPTRWGTVPGLPWINSDDVGKFLRVSDDGQWVAETVLNAEEASF